MFFLFQAESFSYPRCCPQQQPDGTPCPYVAWADRGFRRHLATWHNIRWTVFRRGPNPREEFVEMTPAEAIQRRITLANRQGGCQARAAHFRQQAERHPPEAMPPPPPAARRRRPRSPSQHRPYEHLGPPPLNLPPSRHRQRNSQPPETTTQSSTYGPSREFGEPAKHRSHSPASTSRSTSDQPTVAGYEFVAYHRTTSDSSSSLHEEDFTSENRRLIDDIVDYAEGRGEYVFTDLHEPISHIGAIRTGPNFDSDLEGVNPDVIFGTVESDRGYDTPILERMQAGLAAQDRPYSKASAAASIPPFDPAQSQHTVPEMQIAAESNVSSLDENCNIVKGKGHFGGHISSGYSSVPQYIPPPPPNEPTPLELSLSSAADTADGLPLFHILKDTDSQTEQSRLYSTDIALSPRPVTPPPERCDASQQAQPITRNRRTQISIPPNCTDTASWTGEVPRPWLSTPSVNLHKMAELQCMLADADQLCPVQYIADKVTAHAQSEGTTVSQRRSIQFAVNYSSEVQRYMAGQLLANASNRYFHMTPIPWEHVARYLLDSLSVINRRPGMPDNPPYSETEEEFDWLM